MIKKFLLVGTILATTTCCFAESVSAPHFLAGDQWTYQDTVEKGQAYNQTRQDVTVVRATDSSIYVTAQPTGSTQTPKEFVTGIDWSRVRNVNGAETTVNKPFSFPLSEGKSWKVDYTEMHPTPNQKSEQFALKYKVIGPEVVTVPAGKFTATKVEAEGTWTIELEPKMQVVQMMQRSSNGIGSLSQISPPKGGVGTGKLYKAFWYVPGVKRWVKSVEEYYNTNGERTERYTSELVSYKAGQ